VRAARLNINLSLKIIYKLINRRINYSYIIKKKYFFCRNSIIINFDKFFTVVMEKLSLSFLFYFRKQVFFSFSFYI
jgi:hypothetical protein